MAQSHNVSAIVAALRAGGLAVLPTDTVYGLVALASDESAAAALYRLKGREAIQPTAVLAASVDGLLEAIPELDERVVAIARELLPGAYTLVVENPARRFAWLAGGRAETIGVRVPALTAPVTEIVSQLGLVVATSANLAGGPDPCRLADVPEPVLAGVAGALDGGELPGVPSTVIDLTVAKPAILRAGAGDAERALALVAALQPERRHFSG